MLLGVAGSGLANIAVVPLYHVLPSGGWAKTIGLSVVFSINMVFQGFGTSSALKLTSSWYSSQEAGLFTALFNVWITFGRFVANTFEVRVAEVAGWPYVFCFPGLLQLTCCGWIYMMVRATPEEAGLEPATSSRGSMPLLAGDPEKFQNTGTGEVSGQAASPWRDLVSHPLFFCYLMATLCVPFSGDGFTTWIYSFFADGKIVSADSAVWLDASGRPLDAVDALPPNESIGFAIWAGAAIGGIVLGFISDRFFKGSRLEPMVIFTVIQAVALRLVYWAGSPGSGAGPWTCTALVFVCCFFVLGNYSLLSYAVPVDFGVELASLCGGVMTCASYLGSGMGGAVYAELITRFGYVSWWASMETATAVTAGVLVLGCVFCKRQR